MKHLPKLIEYGLYLWAFLLPWQTRWLFGPGRLPGGASEYLSYSLYGSDILLAALLVAGLVWQRSSQPRPALAIGRSIAAPALALLAAAVVSIGWATDWLLAAYAAVALAAAGGLAWLALTFADRLKLAYWLVLGLMLSSWLAVWQFLTQGSFGQKWLGLAKHDPAVLGTSVIELYPVGELPERWLRAYGSFDHPNILGGSAAIGLLLAIGLFVSWTGSNAAANWRWLLYPAIGSLAAGLVVSFSRGAWLAAAIGLLVGSFSYAWKRDWPALRGWLWASGLALVVFLAVLSPYRSLASARLSGEGRLEQKSTTERLAGYRQVRTLLDSRGLLGVGAGNYVPALARLEPGWPAWYYQPVHNVYLLVLAELGVIGLAGLLLLWFGLVRAGQAMPLAVLAALAALMLFDHWLWSLHFGRLFLGLVLALVLVIKKE